MPDLEDDAGALGRLDHRLRLVDADRHRLLGQDVLLRGAGFRDMAGVQLGRGRDIDGVKRARSQHRRQVGVPRNTDFSGRGLPHLRCGLRHGGQLECGIAANRGNKRPAGRSHSNDSDTDFAGHTCSYGVRLVTLAARE